MNGTIKSVICCIVCVPFLIAACGSEPPSPVVAVVNGEKITEADLAAKVGLMPGSMQEYARQGPKQNELLKKLIEETLLLQEARKQKLDQDPDVRARIEAFEKMTIIAKLQENMAEKAAPIDDDRIAAYYKQHKSLFNIPAMVKVRRIVVKDSVTAKNLRKKLIKSDRAFAGLAEKYSIDPASKSRGGVLGYIRQGTREKAFEDAVFALKKKGDITPVFKTKEGYQIVQLMERRDAVERTLAQVKGIIRSRIMKDEEAKGVAELVERLKKEANIKFVTEKS